MSIVMSIVEGGLHKHGQSPCAACCADDSRPAHFPVQPDPHVLAAGPAPTAACDTPSHTQLPLMAKPSHTPLPLMAKHTHTPLPLMATPSHTPLPLMTKPSHTPLPLMATPSHTPLPLMAKNSHTPLPLMATPSHTPLPLMAKPSHTPLPLMATPSHTPLPLMAKPSHIPLPLLATAAPEQARARGHGLARRRQRQQRRRSSGPDEEHAGRKREGEGRASPLATQLTASFSSGASSSRVATADRHQQKAGGAPLSGEVGSVRPGGIGPEGGHSQYTWDGWPLNPITCQGSGRRGMF